MTFFEMAKVSGGEGFWIAGARLPDSDFAAVFCGAITYIGNGPNLWSSQSPSPMACPCQSPGRHIGYAFTRWCPSWLRRR